MANTDTRINWTGSFANTALERAFISARRDALQRFLTVSLAVATVIYLAYGLHDAWIVPQVRRRAWVVRYGVFLPVAIIVMLLVRTRWLERVHQLVALWYGLSACFVVLYIAEISPLHGFYIYSSYAVVFVTLGPIVGRMNVPTQLLYSVIATVMYNVLEYLHQTSEMKLRLSTSATLLTLGGLGALLAYLLDRGERQVFLQERVIREQVRALDAEKQRSEELLLNVLPATIAERLKAGDSAIADGFEGVSVLFADLVGFTQMSARLSPKELVGRLNEVFSSFDDLVEKLKLEKIKTIGDAYMVAGGLHSREFDHAQATAEMALAMQRRVQLFSKQFGETLRLRIGIHTGPVVAGVIGKKKFIYDVWGDTVNTASRMESHAPPGAIQVTAASYRQLSQHYRFEARGEIPIKGKGTMKTWLLLGPRDESISGKTALPQLKHHH